jgi:DNA-binding response OmpR family regulator
LIFPLKRSDLINIDLKEEIFTISPIKILCIDDEERILQMISDMLQESNHEIKLALSGKLGLEKFLTALDDGKPFDLVITDLGMPYMDGKSVAQSIKSIYPKVPVILMTGWGSFLEQDKILIVDFILKKPITTDELNKAIKFVLHKKILDGSGDLKEFK